MRFRLFSIRFVFFWMRMPLGLALIGAGFLLLAAELFIPTGGVFFVLSVSGIAVGVVFAAAAGSALRSFLFGVTVHDPTTYVAVPVLLSAAALAGAYIPGRRAARIDPLVALRAD